LAARRITLQLVKGKRSGLGDHAVDREAPVSEASGLKVLERIIQGRHFVGERRVRNLAPRELTGERMPGQQSLGGVGQGFAEAVDSAVIGRDQSIVSREALGHAQAENACRGRESGGDQFAA
jgi:hypothetical protein